MAESRTYGVTTLDVHDEIGVAFHCDHHGGAKCFRVETTPDGATLLYVSGAADDLRGFARKILDACDELDDLDPGRVESVPS